MFWNPGPVELIVASDVHLVDMDEPNAKLMLRCLESIAAAPVENLVMLGDIFDIALGSSRYFQKRFAALGCALEKVAESGTEVYFVEGNHEFDIAKMPWKHVNFVPEGNLRITTSLGTNLQFAHGDMVYSHNAYKRFRAFVKHPIVKGAASLLPGSLFNGLATKSSDLSRSQDKYREIKHDEILAATNVWVAESDAEHGIFGHFHVPYSERRKDGKGMLLGLNSWDTPNFLVLKKKVFHRVFFDKRGEPYEKPIQSFFTDKSL